MRAVAMWVLAFLAIDATACEPPVAGDDRTATIASVLAQADESLILSRPSLVAGKYRLMAGDAFSFYRGTFPLYLHDVRDGVLPIAHSRFALGDVLVCAIGDAHPENFGTLVAPDGSLALEPNDFDSADVWPVSWDLRRLTVGLALFAQLANADDPAAQLQSSAAAQSVARAAAEAWLDEIVALSNGAPRPRVDDPGTSTVLEDLFGRAARNLADRSELQSLTVLNGTTRTLVRGVLDPTDPENTFADLPDAARAALPDVLAAYRTTLIAPPPPAFFTILDAVREFGAGVASWPRVRAIVLVRGPSDDPSDDVLLEVKEEADSSAGGWLPPGVFFDDVPSRVIGVSRAAWARPDADPLWGTATWLGLPVQIRTESDANKGVKLKRLVGDRATPDALIALARVLGALEARIHASALPTHAAPLATLAGLNGPLREAFLDEQAAVALSYAATVRADWVRFQSALRTLGPTLGITPGPSDAPPADLEALFVQGEPGR